MRLTLRSSVPLWLIALLLALPAVGQRAGETNLGVDGDTVSIRRDGYGVPHVSAETERGVYFGNGYAVAQDRLAQMEKYRRQARGEMAEMVGQPALASDKETRTIGYTEAEREAQLAAASSQIRRAMQSYADGVNAYIQQCERTGFTAEVRKLRVQIRPWKVTDSIAIGQMMARRFGGGGAGELRNLQVMALLKGAYGEKAQQVFDDLVWQNDPAAPTTIPASESRDRRASPTYGRVDVRTCGSVEVRTGGGTRAGGLQPRPLIPSSTPPYVHTAKDHGPLRPQDVERARAAAAMEAEIAFAAAQGLFTRWGSYAIAVAPSRRSERTAALVGGPQMGFGTPSICHEVHLSTAELNVIGMSFAGVPGVLIGHNDRIAWTTTTGVGDLEDIFAETLDPADPERYRFKGEWRPVERRVERILVRDADPVEHEVRRTVHGPLLQVDRERHLAYARKASYWDRELGALEAIHQFNRARTLRDFANAVPRIATSHNWLCATRDGDIGYWFAGHFPIRAPGVDPRLPTPGEGSHEWRGLRPFAELPRLVNPRQGYLANWNNKPAAWWPNGDTPAWGSVHRVQRILDLLAEKPRLTTDDLKRILRDISTYDDRAPALKPLLIRAADSAGDRLDATARDAVRALQSWDNHNTDGSVGKQIFDTYVQQLRREIVGNRFALVPQNLLEQALSAGVLLRMLQGSKARLPVRHDYLDGRTADEVMLAALRKSIETLTKDRGAELSAWGYRRGQIRFEPLPPIPAMNRGTYIQIVELARPRARGVSILPPGQNEEPTSPHHADQRELAANWLFKPMIATREGLGN